MRAMIIPMALCVAACGGEADMATEGETPTIEAPAEEVATAYDGGPVHGTYEATSNDGVVLIQTASEDGTITSVDGDGQSVAGTYTMGDGQFCITNEGADELCFAYSDLNEDGSWTATNVADPEDAWTVRRVDG